MSSKSILVIAFFTFLILVGLISHKRDVNYLTYTLRVPQDCKASTESNVNCQDYQIYWHYTEEKSHEALVRQFTNQILHNSNYELVDTIQFDTKNPRLSTLIFENDSEVVTTISFGMLQNRYVVIVFEPKRSLQSIQQFPEFVKNLLSLS